MNPTEHTLWVSVIIVGFVVVVAVAALLSLLIYLIKRIDHRVDTIGGTLTAAKANTAEHRADPAGRHRRGRGTRRGARAPPVPRPGTRKGQVMTVLVVLTVIVIVALIAGLAVYLYWAGTLLDRIGAKLEGAAEHRRTASRPTPG